MYLNICNRSAKLLWKWWILFCLTWTVSQNEVILWSSTTKPWKHSIKLRSTGVFYLSSLSMKPVAVFEKKSTKKCLEGRTIWIFLVCILFVSRVGAKVWTLAGKIWAMACLMHVLASCTKGNNLVKLSRPVLFPTIFDEQEKL